MIPIESITLSWADLVLRASMVSAVTVVAIVAIVVRLFPQLLFPVRRIVANELIRWGEESCGPGKQPADTFGERCRCIFLKWIQTETPESIRAHNLTSKQSTSPKFPPVKSSHSKTSQLPRRFKILKNVAVNRHYDTFLCQRSDGHLNKSCSTIVKFSKTDFGDRLISREQCILRSLQYSVGSTVDPFLPLPLETFEHSGHCGTAFQHDDALVELATWKKENPFADSSDIAILVFAKLLEQLVHTHKVGTIHSAILPQHVLMHPNADITLVDWTHAIRSGHRFRFQQRRYRQWYPPEITQGGKATPATDIYMAAKVAVFMAGDGQLTEIPKTFNPAIQRFLRACLFESAAMRPNDCLSLHEDLMDIYEVSSAFRD